MDLGLDLRPATLLTRAVVLLIAMAVHEFAHAYVAFRMGDTTARDMGRMTLDPRANINWLGFAFGVLTGFGILGSAPVNKYRMRDPRWGHFYAVLAGPVSNLLLAIPFGLAFRFGLPEFFYTIGDGTWLPTPATIFGQMLIMNVVLFVFNLLPLYPLDGWSIMLEALPMEAAIWWERHRQTNMYIFMGLILLSFAGGRLGFDPLGLVIGQPAFAIINLLVGR